jgi:preprotein translocase subunit YajC
MTVIASLALLQAAPGGMGSILPLVFQFAAIFAIFYFVMIRPQQKQRREHDARLRSLRRGDEVVTSGGIVGKIVQIREIKADETDKSKVMDDHLTISSGESRLVIERGKIAKVITPAPAKSADAS